ncbi:ABC transporter substrate-binding protein [Rhodococcus sp. X156]|uniref:ABC transporter substrate-binding protein n=1 Tax=Rhodococcus sp. X156 TaxID=2499145 RepID=UPI000FD76D2A|nr:ABC transporter substrate-binding protein [Rhodococcus sp. X156]
MKRTRKSRMAVLAGLATTAALVLSACGGGASGGGAGGDTLRLAFNADMQVPDPDIFYEIEGNALTTSVYEGLVRYKPDSTEIEPALASSYTVSPDGRTYTFTLRDGVTFHDGTPLDSAAAKASFQRRLDVNSAPAYMLSEVVDMTTPAPMTFVVTLGKPVSAFLDYLAAPYGPKMVSPKVLADHAGSDHAQSYLKDHDAGTGPFTLTEFINGQRYVLSRYDGYWGTKAAYGKVVFSIVPDTSTQRLQLEGGQLDMSLHGYTTDDISSFRSNPGFTVTDFPAVFKSFLFLDENKGVFTDQKVRLAVRQALDREELVRTVYGDRATPSTQVYPAAQQVTGGSTTAPVDPSVLKNLVSGLGNKKVDLAYVNDDSTNQRMAELIQTKLSAAGLQVTTRPIPMAQAFDLPNQPESARPDMVLSTLNPDAVHPDTYARIFMSTAGSLNWLQSSVPAADAAMDRGLNATDPAEVSKAYAAAGDAIAASGLWLDIADVKETVIARKGIGNLVHQLPTLNTVRLGDLVKE